MARTSTVPLAHPESFFIGGSWVAPSSDSTIDVIDAGTEELAFTIAEAQAADMAHAVEAARTAFDEGPWPQLTHAERAGYLRALERGADGAQRRAGRAVATRIGRARQHGAVLGDDGGQRPRDLRRARRHLRVRGAGAAVGPRLRPARARAGGSGRSDHPVERAGAADHAQDRSCAARGLLRRAQDVTRGTRRGLCVRRGRGGRRAPGRRAQRGDRRPRGVAAARHRPARRQDHVHRLHRRGPQDRVALR